MPRSSQLGDSWGRISDNSDGEYHAGWQVEEEQPEQRRKAKARRTNASTMLSRSPEPELIMPSLDEDTLSSSMHTSPIKKPRSSRAPRSAAKISEQRRRTRGRATEKREQSLTDTISSPKQNLSSTPYPPPDFFESIMNHVGSIISWALSVIGQSLRILKTPIAYGLAVFMLLNIVNITRNFVTNSIYASLSPACSIPGVSLLGLSFCPTKPSGPPEFKQLITVQSEIEEVLEEASGGLSLPFAMKHGEASIRDLRQLVKFSQLRSKQELILEFNGFIETSMIASYDLQKFNSHVGRTVDTVLSTTRWTTRVLEDLALRESQRGAIGGAIDRALSIFKPTYTEQALLHQYMKHTHAVEGAIFKLIQQAEALLQVLENLEERLDAIHGIATGDDIDAKAKKDEILAELWTMLGGNRTKINKLEEKLEVLKHVGDYRKTALAHVTGSIIKLQAIGAGLEDLRERVESPKLQERLDVPLEVHMENIVRGVERLEASRENTRQIEKEYLGRILERSQKNEIGEK